MLFNSLEFFVLMLASLALYWALDSQPARERVLLVSSLTFYGFWYPPHLILLIGLVAIAHVSTHAALARRSRTPLAAGVAVTLAVLAYWKYAAFIAGLLQGPLSYFGLTYDAQAIHIALPLGISFIAFQIIAYMVDVWWGAIPREPCLARLVLFISFYPQLIAGPICRGAELLPQLRERRPFLLQQLSGGAALTALGLALKLAFADTLSPYVEEVYRTGAEVTGGAVLVGTVAFAVQILADFWGYSTMAVGLALMFGVTVPINFSLPYLSTSLREFWRRWHITLSSWLRDYLYKQVGGSRGGRWQTSRNLLITMGLGGLWHGANTTFVIWGLLHGTWLALERSVVTWVEPWLRRRLGRMLPWVARPVGWALTLGVVLLGWIFFRADSVDDALRLIATLGSIDLEDAWRAPRAVWTVLIGFALVLVPAHRAIEGLRLGAGDPWSRAIATCWLLVLSAVLSADETVPFIYFQF